MDQMKELGKSGNQQQLFLQFKDQKLNSAQSQGNQYSSQYFKKQPESQTDTQLQSRVSDLQNQNLKMMQQMDDMRKNYHKELSAKSGLEYMNEIQRKKRYEKAALKVNQFGKQMPHELIEPLDYGQQVTFFDATNNIDQTIKDMLNLKLQKMKDNFQDWQVRSIDYSTTLLKKLYMYEQVSKEYHGIVNMTPKQIFEGIKFMDERPEDLWENVIDVFGHQFFLPVIEKFYAHLFVNDTSKQNSEIQNALNQTTKNEESLRYQCDIQLQDFKLKIQELQTELVDRNLKSVIQIENAKKEGRVEGKEWSMNDNEQQIQQFQKQISNLEAQNQQLMELTKESRKVIQNEMMKTFITKLIFYKKQINKECSEEYKNEKSKSIFSNQLLNKADLQFDYITGQKNQFQILEIKNELEETKFKISKLEYQNIKLVLENSYLKRTYQKQYEQIELLEGEIEQIKKGKTSKIENSEMTKSESKEIELLKHGLVTQGELLKSITAERDRLLKEVVQLSCGKYKTEKSVQVDQMVRAAKSIVSFQGWNNLSFIKNIKYRESKATITDLQDIRKECTLESFPTKLQINEPSLKQLRTYYKLPLVDNQCQTQMFLLKDFMKQKGYRHKQSLKKPIQEENSLLIENEDTIQNTCQSCSSDEINKLIGEKLEKYEKQKEHDKLNQIKLAQNQQIQCDILDYEQINLFISDSLCYDFSLRKIVEAKRRFEIIPYGQTDNLYVGGIRIKQKGEKLKEEQKEEYKNQLKQMQSSFQVQKKEFSTNKFPLLQGVFSRLWKDAGLKEERMEQLRTQIEDMLREQLMKKLIVQNQNKKEYSHLKNSLIIKNFLDQVNTFIKSNLRTNSPEQEHKSSEKKIKKIDVKLGSEEDKDSQKSSGSLLDDNKMKMQYENLKDVQFQSNLNFITKNISKQSVEAKDIVLSCKYFQDQLKLIIQQFRKQTKNLENSIKRNISLSQDKMEAQNNLQSKQKYQKNQYINVKVRPQTSSSICQEDKKFLENQYGHLINIQDKQTNLSQTNNSTKSIKNNSFQQFQTSNEIMIKDSLNFKSSNNILIKQETKINSPQYIQQDLELLKYKKSRNLINLKNLTAPKTKMKQAQFEKKVNLSREEQTSTGNLQSSIKELGSLLEIQKKDLTELHPYSYSIDSFRDANQLNNQYMNQDLQFQTKRKSHQQFTNAFLIDDVYKKQESNVQILIKDQQNGKNKNVESDMKKIQSLNVFKNIQNQQQYVFELYEQDRQLQRRLNSKNYFNQNKNKEFILQNQSLKDSFRNVLQKDIHGLYQNYEQNNNSTQNIEYQQNSQQKANELNFQSNNSQLPKFKSIDQKNIEQRQRLREIIMKNDQKLKEQQDQQNQENKIFSSSQYQLKIRRQSLKQNINSQSILKMVNNKQNEQKEKQKKKLVLDDSQDQLKRESLSTLQKLTATHSSTPSFINQKHYVNKNFIVERQSQGYAQRIKNDYSNSFNSGSINVIRKKDGPTSQYYQNI